MHITIDFKILKRAKVLFGVVISDYTLIEFVRFRSTSRRGAGRCRDTRTFIADNLGMTTKGLRKMINKLEGKGLLDIDPVDGSLLHTQAWFDLISAQEQSSHEGNKVPIGMGTKFPIEGNKVLTGKKKEVSIRTSSSSKEETQQPQQLEKTKETPSAELSTLPLKTENDSAKRSAAAPRFNETKEVQQLREQMEAYAAKGDYEKAVDWALIIKIKQMPSRDYEAMLMKNPRYLRMTDKRKSIELFRCLEHFKKKNATLADAFGELAYRNAQNVGARQVQSTFKIWIQNLQNSRS